MSAPELEPELAELLKPPPPHLTVLLRAGKLVAYPVDVEIAPLVERLWQLGFWTQFSCQGDLVPGQLAYVCFSGDETAAQVAGLIGLEAATWSWETIFGVRGVFGPADQANIPLHIEPADGDSFRSVLRWQPTLTPEITARLEAL